MSSSAPIDTPAADPVAPPPDPPSQDPAAPPAPEPPQDEPVTDDAAVLADIEAKAIPVPDGERLVPESVLRNVAISYRNKLKEAKQGSPEAANLKAELDRVNQQLAQAMPLAQAFQALQSAQGQPATPPATPQAPPPPENTADLDEIAKDFDFYKPDGALDLDRARRHQARVQKQAEQIADAKVQPLVDQSVQQRAAVLIARAKKTTLPGTKEAADPAILDNMIARIASQKDGWSTLADPEAMKHLWVAAYGQTQAMKIMRGQGQTPPADPPAAPVTPPVVTERSGGQAPTQQRALSSIEKKAAKDAGMTEKQYLEVAAKMPW